MGAWGSAYPVYRPTQSRSDPSLAAQQLTHPHWRRALNGLSSRRLRVVRRQHGRAGGRGHSAAIDLAHSGTYYPSGQIFSFFLPSSVLKRFWATLNGLFLCKRDAEKKRRNADGIQAFSPFAGRSTGRHAQPPASSVSVMVLRIEAH